MMKNTAYLPLKLYGAKISYFTGRMENYLRYKEIPYKHIAMGPLKIQKEIHSQVGVLQFPNIQLANGNWMTDTTPMIQWFEMERKNSRLLALMRT
ncbi:MAG: glutathione S-transferase N-terminal domain-containing protein [Deltaproteobacteria bacterium]|nr:glutathione S-transferase N-terminal domain-containing protein [Deltaproteobacteria bacterium]